MLKAHQLSKKFAECFETISANTPALKDQVFKLRYETFCTENGFDPSKYPDGLETDAYDNNAIHSLLIHRPSGQCAGTLRVITAPPHRSDWTFYTEKIAGEHFFPSFSPDAIPRHSLGEISRFCLSAQFRSRQDDLQGPQHLRSSKNEPLPFDDRRTFPYPILGLIAAAVRISWEHDLLYWYTAMEPRLVRRLKQFGLMFETISDTFEYCGSRRAYLAYLPEMLRGVHHTHPEVWELLTNNGALVFTDDKRRHTKAPHIGAVIDDCRNATSC